MTAARNTLTRLLIVSSILLLMVLQYFWIRGAWSDAWDGLRKETNNVFRNTLVSMRDSAMQRTFETLSPDSVIRLTAKKRFLPDTLRIDDGPPEGEGRTLLFRRTPGSRHRRDHADSSGRRFENGEIHERRDFFFRFAPDSLKIDSIRVHLKKALAEVKVTLPFQVIHFRRGEKRDLPANALMAEPVRISPFSRYSVILFDVRGKMIREILPQVLFCLFLTAITLLSFFVLYRSIQSQQKLVQTKNDFISNITHELKTPIATVSVAIEALRNFKGLNNPSLTEEYLAIAQNELERLSILTDKVLKTAIYESHGLSFHLESLDLENLTDQVVSSLKLILEKSQTVLTIGKAGSDFTFYGDRDHIVSVIYNLLDNAVKYSPAPATITVSLTAEANSLIFEVGDSGPGVAKEYRKKIFEKFFRVPTGDVHNIKGYGLGLSYVDTVVRRHGGTIEVLDNDGKGSRFTVTLPRNQPPPPAS